MATPADAPYKLAQNARSGRSRIRLAPQEFAPFDRSQASRINWLKFALNAR
jgi:hypothetical protein